MRKEKKRPNNEIGNKNFFQRSLDKIEKYGNKLPDIITIFVIITVGILLASFIAGTLGWKAVNPADNEVITVSNLLNKEGIVRILTGLVGNFMSFPPLGMVLVAMLGVGLAESTGLVSALMRKTVLSAPQFLILPIIALVGIVGNAAADAAFVVLPPIAAMLFLAINKHPIAGLVAGYAAVAAGFSANLLLNVLDVTLAGFTQSASEMVDPDFIASPAMNYYFSIVSTFVLIPVVVFVSKKIVEPRLGTYTGEFRGEAEQLTKDETRGLKWAGVTFLVFVITLLVLVIPENALLRDPETGSIMQSPFMSSLIPLILLAFFLPALAYGIASKTIKSDKDVANHLTTTISGMSYYILLSFVAAQMIAYFSWSNLGPVIAIKGANFLKDIGLVGLPLLLGFIILAALINLMIASSTAKWAILAPVFVPMFMYLGYNPAYTQMAYRIGDSITNTITPMLAYFAILLMLAQKYDKNIKIGTLISTLLPYTIFFGIVWSAFFAVWYLLGLPLGPGYGVHLK
ncbi:p-aminobenzoyl-glutamate transporter [Bacillus sp. OxB-1]|uniref:AbgT family transporter n=1 Tax=Bacillus sp. (strain OxB-1) TaxID=98228 RepID=UPI000581CD59|nr:AbgT family transporter [Bacillus sp. OxB-1]BAQ09973.1 p-aminobenzoyl-glutamate transporter [Bacillus sp. OxB-1]